MAAQVRLATCAGAAAAAAAAAAAEKVGMEWNVDTSSQRGELVGWLIGQDGLDPPLSDLSPSRLACPLGLGHSTSAPTRLPARPP